MDCQPSNGLGFMVESLAMCLQRRRVGAAILVICAVKAVVDFQSPHDSIYNVVMIFYDYSLMQVTCIVQHISLHGV
jgi:hypothetical protein